MKQSVENSRKEEENDEEQLLLLCLEDMVLSDRERALLHELSALAACCVMWIALVWSPAGDRQRRLTSFASWPFPLFTVVLRSSIASHLKHPHARIRSIPRIATT